MNKVLKKFNRVISYLLIPVLVFIFITGYRNYDYFPVFTRGIANALHTIYLNASFLILVTIHAIISIRFALMRNNIKGKGIDILLICTGAIFIAGFLYIALASYNL